MFSEQKIDEMVQPLVERQAEVNNSIIKIIAQRIKRIGELLPSDVFKLEMLAKTGADVRKINQEIAKVVGIQVSRIKKIIRAVAKDTYEDAKPFYDYRHKSFIPFEDNERVQRVVKAIERQTSGTYENMSRAQAFMVRDPKNPTVLMPTTAARTYQNVVDKAVQIIQTGGVNYTEAMRETLEEIVESGLKQVTYNAESGKVHAQRMDTALRRNILEGVRAVGQGVQDEVGKQFGADGYEISVHACPAPDHCFIQGHQFTKSEYAKMAPASFLEDEDNEGLETSPFETITDVDGNVYDPIDRKIGTLNCRHFAFAIIIGQAPANYTEEQLKEILDKNKKGYTTPEGKHLTMYECTQLQRKMETNIRRAKDGQIAAKEAGDLELARKYQTKVDKYTKEYKSFSQSCGLSEKPERIRVAGYRKIKKTS